MKTHLVAILSIPEKCNGCGKPLLLENLYCDDGCPCNTPRGVNFTPKPCAICDTVIVLELLGAGCVKPGHRLAELYEQRIKEIESLLRAWLEGKVLDPAPFDLILATKEALYPQAPGMSSNLSSGGMR
jgi:hypothetical protein